MRRFYFVSFALLAVLAFAMPAASAAQVSFSITVGPPVLPVYEQPLCPEPGMIWTPGYWAWGPDGYYWVPGAWVLAPEPGLLWTPGYWGWGGGVYLWHAGYWGPHVGFYGGINYGFGYDGVGYYGGEWRGREFVYNTAYSRVDTRYVHNTYVNRTVIHTTNINRVSYNGGNGGVMARPTSAQMAAERDHHIAATSAQAQNERYASTNRGFLASQNHGSPAVAATTRAGDFSRGVVPSRGAPNTFRPPNGNVQPAHGQPVNRSTPAGNPNYSNRNGANGERPTNTFHPPTNNVSPAKPPINGMARPNNSNENTARGGTTEGRPAPNYNNPRNEGGASHGGNPSNESRGAPNAPRSGTNGGGNAGQGREQHSQPAPEHHENEKPH